MFPKLLRSNPSSLGGVMAIKTDCSVFTAPDVTAVTPEHRSLRDIYRGSEPF